MKTKKLICIIGYAIVLLFTLIMFSLCLQIDLNVASSDDIFGAKMSLFFESLFFLPLVLAEIDLFFSIWCFSFRKNGKSRIKTILQIICCGISGMTVALMFVYLIVYVCMCSISFLFGYKLLLAYVLAIVLLRTIYVIVLIVEHVKKQSN